MRRVLVLLDRTASKFSLIVGVIAIIGMVVLIFPEVIARYVFNHSFNLSEEFSAYLMVVVTFIGLAYVASKDSHIRVQVIISRLPPRIRDRLRAFTLLLFLSFAIILTKTSYDFVLYNYARDRVSMYVALTPLWIPMLSVPVGFSLLCLVLLVRFISSIDKLRESSQ